jgi:hypothetical protein
MLSRNHEVGWISLGQPGLGPCCINQAGPRSGESVTAAGSAFSGIGWLSALLATKDHYFGMPFGVGFGQAIWERW